MKKLLLLITLIPHTIFSWDMIVTNKTETDYEMNFIECVENKSAAVPKTLVIKSKQTATVTIAKNGCAVSNIMLKDMKALIVTAFSEKVTFAKPNGVITIDNNKPTITWKHLKTPEKPGA